jgi:hypothetical protein
VYRVLEENLPRQGESGGEFTRAGKLFLARLRLLAKICRC